MDGIVLGRVGHYFVSSNSDGEDLAGSCQSATVAYVHGPNMVNLGVLNHNGESFTRTSVSVAPPAIGSSFHLNRECPFGR